MILSLDQLNFTTFFSVSNFVFPNLHYCCNTLYKPTIGFPALSSIRARIAYAILHTLLYIYILLMLFILQLFTAIREPFTVKRLPDGLDNSQVSNDFLVVLAVNSDIVLLATSSSSITYPVANVCCVCVCACVRACALARACVSQFVIY